MNPAKILPLLLVLLCASGLCAPGPARAQTPGAADILDDDTPIRLPWADVVALLKRARQPGPGAAPLAFALGPGRVEGEVRGKGLAATIELPLSLFEEGWVAVPLFDALTVRRALLDGKPAALVQDQGHAVLLARGSGDHRLSVELVVPLATPEAASLSFATPVPLSWHLTLPGSEAHLEPATRQSAQPAPGGRVVLDALTPPTPSALVDWSGLKASAVSTRVSAESLTFVTFQEGTTSGRAHFAFEISGARKDRLTVRLPAGLELLSVDGPELASWSVERVDGGQRLVAHLRRPRLGAVLLDFSFELSRPADEVELPTLYADEVEEQRCFLAASAESPLSMTQVQVAGGEAIDAKHLPAHLLRGVKVPFTLAYRYAGAGFSAHVHLERNVGVALAQATIDAAYFTTVLTDDGREVVKATFLVKNNLRPYLAVALPAGATLWAAFVSGESVNPSSEGGRLLLPLVKSREVGEGDTLATHTVEEGWSLSDVALHYYHDASKWRLIEQANKAVLNGNLMPQRGQTLRIPRLSGPGGSELETAFPVELVYSREAPRPGRVGTLDLELAVPDLGVMRAVWTVYLPSRLDPLSFGGNLSQASYIRYGPWRRLRQLAPGPLAVTSGVLIPSAQAHEGSAYSLRKRFSKFEEQEGGEATVSHPRDSLPLVGRPYVFKTYLIEGEQPRLTAVYVDRSLEGPVRLLFLAAGLVLALLMARAVEQGGTVGTWRWGLALAGYGVGVLLVGHYVLGTHGRAALGLLVGAWWPLLQALRRRVREARGWRRALGRVLLGACTLALVLVLAAGLGPHVGALMGLCAIGAGLYLTRSARALAPTAALLLGVVAARPARADELPPRSEVTVPYGKLKALLAEPPPPAPPPRDHSLLSASYDATVARDSLAVEGELEVELYTGGWTRVPLLPFQDSLLAVTVDGRPAYASTADGSGYVLLLRGAGRHRLHLSFVSPVREPGAAPLAVVPGVASALTLHLPAAGLEPEVGGATGVAVSGATVTALVPPDGRAELLWSVRPGGEASGARPPEEVRMSARTLQIVSIDDQRVRIYALVHFRLQRSSTRRFAVQLPDVVELLDVQAQGMEDHQVVSEGGKRVLVVTTSSNVRDEFELSFACDWRPPREGGALPTFAVQGVRSETGTVGIEAAGSTEVQVAEVSGSAAQIDVRSAPELLAHTDRPILHAVRYLRQPYGVKIALARHPEVELETATVDRAEYTTVLSADGRAISQGVFKVRNARRAFLGVTLPAASEVQSVLVGGEPAKPLRDAHGVLLLPLLRSASSDREMRQFDVEVVYLTRLGGLGRSARLPPLLPAIDLRASKVSWALYVPPGAAVDPGPRLEEASDSMQWASAPRAALYARGPAQGHAGGEAQGPGGILPVRFNLPVHGEPQRFWLHYLPAGVAPEIAVSYSPRSLPPAIQALGVLAALGAVLVALVGAFRLRRRA